MPMCSAVHCSLSLAGGTPDYDATPVQYLAQLHVPGLSHGVLVPGIYRMGDGPAEYRLRPGRAGPAGAVERIGVSSAADACVNGAGASGIVRFLRDQDDRSRFFLNS